jgi:hypothetical protein
VTTGENGLFNPVLVNSFFTDPDNWFKLAVQENDLYQWAPQTPVKLVHCEGDSVIPYALSALTEKSMNAAGAASV